MRGFCPTLNALALMSFTLLATSVALAAPSSEITFGSAKRTGTRITAKQQLQAVQEQSAANGSEARAQLGVVESTKTPSFGSARKTSMRTAAQSHTAKSIDSNLAPITDARARLQEQSIGEETSTASKKPAFGSARKTKSHAAF